MSSSHVSEGIVLKAIRFRDYDQILTVFTQAEGIIKLFNKGALRPRKGTATEPLVCAEFVYRPGRTELHACSEVTIIDRFTHLRGSLEQLEAAYILAKVTLLSQPIQAAAPNLYKLLLAYLQTLCKTNQTLPLLSSFMLKLLLHDGLIRPLTHCALCHEQLQAGSFYGGEFFCHSHAPKEAQKIDGGEMSTISALLKGRSFQDTLKEPLSLALYNKIAQFFESCYPH